MREFPEDEATPRLLGMIALKVTRLAGTNYGAECLGRPRGGLAVHDDDQHTEVLLIARQPHLEEFKVNPARAVVALGVVVVLGGCATILGGSSQTITVNSNVSGAQVTLNGASLGVTPLTASIKRGQTGVLSVQSAGYQPYQIALNKKITTLFWVNIFTGGVFGSTTDAATGAMYEYEPSTFMVMLQSGSSTSEELAAWRRTEGLRAFVLQNNEAVVSDLAAGRGEYIDVLTKLLSVTPVDRTDAIARWRAGYLGSKTAAEFAAKLVAELQ